MNDIGILIIMVMVLIGGISVRSLVRRKDEMLNQAQSNLRQVNDINKNLTYILDNIKDGILMLDSEKSIVHANAAALNMMDITDLNEALGEKADSLISNPAYSHEISELPDVDLTMVVLRKLSL